MAHKAALESIICGVGYEFTPTEEELARQNNNNNSSSKNNNNNHHSNSCNSDSRRINLSHKRSMQTKSTTMPEEHSAGASKLRRALSLNYYRNPFSSRKSTDKQQQQQASTAAKLDNHPDDTDDAINQQRQFRRLSWRKFLSKIAQLGSKNFVAKQQQHTSDDRVPSLAPYYQWAPDQTPGVTGLRNHGNTCFMNAVLQCLSHTDMLAEYFVLDQYKADLKRRNKINSKKFGTKGELTEQLALVLKALWTCRDTPEHSTSFKAVVERYGAQFRSSTQHDAQEFLFWLLDKVHEDLNTATKRRYKIMKNTYGRPDEVIAAETLANHIRCNNSFVQAVFQAQFRSSLTCPRCEKQSNTFDPFHCISVQLPQLVQQSVFVTVLYTSQHPKQVKLGLSVPPGSPMIVLKEQLHADTGIPMDRILLMEITETGFSRVFCDSHPISSIGATDPIYCIETPKGAPTAAADAATKATTVTSNRDSCKIILCIANVQRKSESDELKRFGTPLCIQVYRDISYLELQKLLLMEMASVLKSEVFSYKTAPHEMFKIRLQDPSADPDTYLAATVEHPLFTEMIDLALSVVPNDAGPPNVKLLLEWNDPDQFFSDMSDTSVEHESVAQLRDNALVTSSLTLQQCLDHYTKAETLSAEDAWRCPHCQKYLPVVKTLGLWSLPDILVVHFKRFRQPQLKGPHAAKLTTMVKFPLHGFDMSPHLAKMNSESDERSSHRSTNDTKYDLYAVCYHQGDTLETGHYTAACRNPYDHQWYKFDDQRVNQVPKDRIEEEIINDEAYILFYQRRRTDAAECSGSSTSSSEHWISRIGPNVLTSLPPPNPSVAPAIPKPESPTVITDAEVIEVNALVAETVITEVGKVDSDLEKKQVEKVEDGVKVVDTKEDCDTAVEEGQVDEAKEVTEQLDEVNARDTKQDIEMVSQNPDVVASTSPTGDNGDDDKAESPVTVRKSSPISIQTSARSSSNWTTRLWPENRLSESDVIRHSSLNFHSKAVDLDMLRTSSSCSKDSFLFMDQQGHNLLDDDTMLGANHSLWISPVSSHKLITVSPKN